MRQRETFEVFCPFCLHKFEGDSIVEAEAKLQEHLVDTYHDEVGAARITRRRIRFRE